jgi:type III secretion protein X
MSDFRVGSGPFFDRGIDLVTTIAQQSVPTLPGQHELSPAGDAQLPGLDMLLSAPSMDSFLDDAIRPDIENRDALTPTRFRQTLDSTLDSIRQAASELHLSDPEGEKVLNRAGRLLAEEVNLRDLLQMYRSALYAG